MKTCVSCKEAKPATSEFFFFRNKERGWLSSWCKACRVLHRKETKEAELLAQRIRRGLKPCRVCGTTDKPKGNVYCIACFKSKKRLVKKADKAVYKSRLRKAMPSWADKDKIREIYANRPEGMHVDHVIPIRGKLVCGLHVESNLTYLPGEQNMKKSNHFSLEHEGCK